MSDLVLEKNKKYFILGEKISKINHGSGGIHSAGLLFALAKNKSIKESLEFAKQITFDSIKNSRKVGNGIVITRINEQDQIRIKLSKCN